VAGVTAKERAQNAPRGVTLRAFAETWLAKRETETAADDRGRIYNHILPALGDIPSRNCDRARCATSSTR
jgi:hypothetical protein